MEIENAVTNLMANIGTNVHRIDLHLFQQADVIIGIEQCEPLHITNCDDPPTFFVLTVSKHAPSRIQIIFIFL